MSVRRIVEYLDEHGESPFRKWFLQLNAEAAAKVTTAMKRIELGNFSSVSSVGRGVFEYKIDYGPGYRVYFAQDGIDLVILLEGGTKKRQNEDIGMAQQRWAIYKVRKKTGKG
jgi:putative addiction module killer protein